MPYFLREKIRVAVSACNMGTPVRYNMKGWNRLEKLDREKTSFFWVPICPEVNAGLGVPRETIKLVDGNGEDFWEGKARVKNKKGVNVTEQIREGNLMSMEVVKRSGCEAFVFQEGSPTCGIYRTTLKNQRLGKPPGTFGALALREDLFLIPAQDLESPIKWWDWRRRLHAFCWLKREEITDKKQLYEIWHSFKFICQEVSVEEANAIGRSLANMEKFEENFVENWRREVLLLLRKPSNFRRIVSIMEKHWAHYNKHFFDKSAPLPPLEDEVSKAKFVDQLRELEKRAVLEGYDFAGVPVVFRGER